MFTEQVERLAFAQYVVEQAPRLKCSYPTHFEPYLAIVPDDFYCVGTDAAVGQDMYLWADSFGCVLYLVLPGIGIFAAEWVPGLEADGLLNYHPALGVVAGTEGSR